MAENKKAFILYADQKEIFNELTDDYAGKLIKHIFKYVTDENPTTDDMLLRVSFALIKTQLKRDLKKYEAKSEARSESGRLGGIASGEARRIKAEQNEANEANASKPKQNEQDIDIVTDKGIDIEKEIKEIYSLYPAKCPIKKNSTGKGSSNKSKIKSLLKDKTAKELKDAINFYVEDCKKHNVYLKNFTTFLNNIPDIEEIPQGERRCLMTSGSHKVPVEKPYSFYLKELSYFGPDEVKLIKMLP